MQPYPDYPETYLERLPRTTRQSLATYSEPLGRLSQLPRELQIEALMRMSYEDLGRICLSNNPPGICFSEEFWKNRFSYGEFEEFTHEMYIICEFFGPIITDILEKTSKPGPTKYYMIKTGSIMDTNIYSAPDIRGAIVEIYRGTRDKYLYCDAMHSYIFGVFQEGDTFSFNKLVNHTVSHLQGQNAEGIRIFEVFMK